MNCVVSLLYIQASIGDFLFRLTRLHFISKRELVFLVLGSFYNFVHLYIYRSGRWGSLREGIVPVYEITHS